MLGGIKVIYSPIKTLSDFKNKITFNVTTETLYWDFKEQINPDKFENIAIDISAFANSMGGSLLIGISESKNDQNLRVAKGINPNMDIEQTRSFLSGPIKNKIKPYIKFEQSIITFEEGKSIISVNIEPSIDLVGVNTNIDKKAFCFPYREDFGNKYFDFNEMEFNMHNNEGRANFLKIHKLIPNPDVPIEVDLYPIPYGIQEEDVVRIKIIKESLDVFELQINSSVIQLPYSIIDEIWNRANVGTNLVLKLREKLFKNEDVIDFDYPEVRSKYPRSYAGRIAL
jgi:hypothetical protein